MYLEDGVNVAIAGASGAVGETLLEILQERKFPVRELFLLASERSEGKRLQFHGKSIMIKRLDEFDFSQTKIGLFSAGGDISAEFAPKAAAQGCVVIDNTSRFRYDDEIPLVVPEVNPHRVADYTARNIIANPNCSNIIEHLISSGPSLGNNFLILSRTRFCRYLALAFLLSFFI